MRIIAGIFKGLPLKTPKGSSTRPTQGMVREAIFNICQNTIENSRFLDLFAGSGAIGLEALSRGATFATFVEQNKKAIRCIQENIASLKIEKSTRIIHADYIRALSLLTKEKSEFDLIYIDPPYDLQINLIPVIPLLAQQGKLFLEERYAPKKPLEVPGLNIEKTKKFGTSQLTIFELMKF